MPSPLPHVFYLNDKFQPAAQVMESNVSPMEHAPFEEVFTKHHTKDAHLVTYQVAPLDLAMPRLSKAIAPRIRQTGNDIVATMILLDWDMPGHQPLTREAFDDLMASLVGVSVEIPWAMKWILCYSSRNGVRLVYVLEIPVPVEQAEQAHRGMAIEFNRRGIAIDNHVQDWTRLFRLPYIVRDKKPTGEDPVQEYIFQKDNRVTVEEIPRVQVASGSRYADLQEFDGDRPTPEEAKSLIWTDWATGKSGLTDFGSQAKKMLRGRECFPCIFEMARMAERGHRDATIHQYAGQAVSMLFLEEGCTPAHIYGLLLQPVEQLDRDVNEKPWEDILWSAVRRLWAKEDARVRYDEEQVAASMDKMKDVKKSVEAGMREWVDEPTARQKLAGDTPEVFTKRHMVALCGHSCYVMGVDGYYDPTPISDKHIISMIRSRGLEGMFETRKQTADGQLQDKSNQAIVNEAGTIVKEIIAMPSPRGGYIKDMNTPQARLVLPAYWRNERLEKTAAFSREADDWLQFFFGDGYPDALRWIAWSLAFDEGPICAMSIEGRQGSGKKMLVQGLGECLRIPRVATSEDMVGDYNYGLLETPYLSVDEGWVKPGRGRHPADQFRAMVAGDGFEVRRKFMSPVLVRSPVRVIFTANNKEAIRVLTHKRDLSTADREALAIRLMHFSIRDEASHWIAQQGGLEFTGRAGGRWIRGDGGEESDYILARHFMHLYLNRHNLGKRDGRFLVEGNASQEVLFELRTQAGSSPMVIETVLKMVERKGLGHMVVGMLVEIWRLFVSVAGVLEYYRKNVQDTARSESLSADQVLNALRGIEVKHPEKNVNGHGRMVELDTRTLLSVAQRDGWDAKYLAGLVEKSLMNSSNLGSLGLTQADIKDKLEVSN